MALKIYYDGECPFCSQYVRLMRLREAMGPVDLVDLRTFPVRRAELEAMGFDLDQGMVIETEDGLFGGADATAKLAAWSRPEGIFNRINHAVMRHQHLSALIYPLLRSGRWLVLFLLGRQGFARFDPGTEARASVFSMFFALFSLFHVMNYSFEYARFPPGPDMWLIAIAAIALLARPQSPRLLFALMLVSTISTWAQAPIGSNHTMVRSVLLAGYWIAFFWTMAEGRDWGRVFTRFAPAGQGALLVMYFFGVFHKINTDFLNPISSCAVALWREMPVPLSLIDFPAMHYLAIYGTFLVEGLIVVMLLIPRLRHIGVVSGIAFHGLLSLSNYAMYISFTTLSMALHVLFLSPGAAQRSLNAPELRFIRSRLGHPAYVIALILVFLSIFVLALFKHYTAVTLLLLPLLAPFCYIVVRYGAPESGHRVRTQYDRAGITGAALTTTLFFVLCLAPYAGLRTAQSINMFANLRLEGGVSNHLVLRNGTQPFGYLGDVVTLTGVENDLMLEGLRQRGLGLVYYEFLNMLERNPEAVVSYERGGTSYSGMTAALLADEIEKTLHPAWVRKWFHFQPVSLAQPETCNV